MDFQSLDRCNVFKGEGDQGFLDYTTQRGNKGGSHQNDTALFYDQIKSKLQLEFNKNQLVEKLRRLKKKYRNVLNKIAAGKEVSFKSPHDQATFEISRKIWSNNGCIAAADNPLDDEDPNPDQDRRRRIPEIHAEITQPTFFLTSCPAFVFPSPHTPGASPF
ncbi:probable transcription factor At5g28040 [Argentina anserina]|uniref:probable transcription factor At5g28040 n=1 Tax=Argentina anserina TaxID=57926 RepID=UPI0021764DC9|nr:probable transcription factor At5g28040 [Potentilla anserina]